MIYRVEWRKILVRDEPGKDVALGFCTDLGMAWCTPLAQSAETVIVANKSIIIFLNTPEFLKGKLWVLALSVNLFLENRGVGW